MYVSAFGPKSMALAARHGDGVVIGVSTAGAMEAVWRLLDAGAGQPVDRDRFHTAALSTMVVLERGEAIDSDRVKAECGAFAMAVVHYAYEQWSQYGVEPPAFLAGIWDGYTALLAKVPAERRHLRIHLGHNCWVEPEEERFLTPDVLTNGCMVGPADELAERLDGLAAAGLHELMLLPTLATKEQVLRDVAAKVLPEVAAP
jgi:alkanesulfonate monooxygenase SsuD/methylene tetrahydromethanopterin reductase-like flavin-dependent oxidoreductase (luciferase family)